MNITRGVGEYVVTHLLVHLSAGRRLHWQGLAKQIARFLRQRLPDRPIPNGFQVFDDVVEGPVSESPQFFPVVGIQRFLDLFVKYVSRFGVHSSTSIFHSMSTKGYSIQRKGRLTIHN